MNEDIGPTIATVTLRRLDYLGVILAGICIIIDGMFFHGWAWALSIDPLIFIFGLMMILWFV